MISLIQAGVFLGVNIVFVLASAQWVKLKTANTSVSETLSVVVAWIVVMFLVMLVTLVLVQL